MNETLRKQMEEMAKEFEAPYCSASHNCSNPYQAFEVGFTACSQIYEAKLDALKEENKRLRKALEYISKIEYGTQQIAREALAEIEGEK